MQEKKWYNLEADETVKSLGSSHKGLTTEEATKRLAQYGPNTLTEEKKINPWAMIAEQFKSLLIIILMAAVVLSVVLGIIQYEPGGGLPEEITDAIVIFVIVIACVFLGFIEEFRSEKAMAALKKMTADTATVIRNGNEIEVPAAELVPGDVVMLSAGDKIPADIRLLEAINLRVEEAALTGESVPVEKVTRAIAGDVGIGDRRNMAFSGTAIAIGRGHGIVAATGMQTEFGKIAKMLQEVEESETPLEQNLDKVGKVIGYACLGVVAIVAIVGIVRGHPILEMIIWGVSLAVAAVPEALSAVVVISLSIGVQSMAKRHALIRRLAAVETLGCTNVICSDKTGTLTQDEMTVRQVYVDGRLLDVTGVGYEPKGEFQLNNKRVEIAADPQFQTLMRINALCNDSKVISTNGSWDIKGDPTEGALVVAALKAGVDQDKANASMPRIDEVPFTSERKKMTTIHETPSGKIAYSKGAPEMILDACSHILRNGQAVQLTENDRKVVLDTATQMASNALRTLGMAYRTVTTIPENKESLEAGMVFVGLSGMIDPPRPEVKEAIKVCDKAGIKSIMITGDHKITAMAVAKELGLLKPNGMAITGAEFDKLSDAEYEKVADKIDVYARVSPAHKLRVVEAFSKKGNIVAMTGDGVNDAPALKRADIGIAMGITGTDVSKEAAAMVLTDDNFASIVSAVEEGRGIFDNIKKYLIYLLSCNVGEVLIMFVAGLFNMPLPLVAIHLLWVNLTTDGLPAIALAMDPHDPDVMEREPRSPKTGIFDREVIITIIIIGVVMALTMLPAFLWRLTTGGYAWNDPNNPFLEEAQSMTLATMVMFELFTALACRSQIHSVFKIGLFSNKWLILADIGSLVMLFAVMYIPVLQAPFHVVPLEAEDWLLVVPISLSGFVSVEVIKIFFRASAKRKAASR